MFSQVHAETPAQKENIALTRLSIYKILNRYDNQKFDKDLFIQLRAVQTCSVS